MNHKNQNHPESQEPFDARLSPLLDKALAPEIPPAELTEKILSATRLPLARAAARPAVLAYIGPGSIVRAVAAAIVLAALLGVGFISGSIFRDAQTAVRGEAELVALSDYREPSTKIDQEIRVLAVRVDLTRATVDSEAAAASVDPTTMTWPDSKAASQPGELF